MNKYNKYSMYQGIYVAPLQTRPNKNVNKDMNLFACRWEEGMVIVASDHEESAVSIACERVSVSPEEIQVSKLPNSRATGEPRILYMEVRGEDGEVRND